MGNQLDKLDNSHHSRQLSNHDPQMTGEDQRGFEQNVRSVVPWLDEQTLVLVAAIIAAVAAEHPAVQAVILFGSLARHEERPLDDPHPSDVDLLLLVTPDPVRQRLPYAQQLALWRTIGDVEYQYRDAPREAQVTLVETTLADWDELFITNVARDGILLWRRGESGAACPAAPGNETQEAGISGAPLPDAWGHLA